MLLNNLLFQNAKRDLEALPPLSGPPAREERKEPHGGGKVVDKTRNETDDAPEAGAQVMDLGA